VKGADAGIPPPSLGLSRFTHMALLMREGMQSGNSRFFI